MDVKLIALGDVIMKKSILCILLIASLIVSSSGLVLADSSFTMRNGVQFGMKLSQIEKLETFKRIKGTLDSIYAYGYGTVSGIKDSSVEYHFDRSGGLKSLEIDFSGANTKRSKIAIQGEYERISSQLKEKYGTPLGNTNGKAHYLRGNEFSSFVGNYNVWAMVGAKVVYEEWLIEQNTGSIKIDHLYCGSSHILEYTYFSKSEINSMFNDL